MVFELDLKKLRFGTELLKRGFAKMQKGGVVMDVTNDEQARIAEEAGAVAVMALERVPADIRAEGGVARMADPQMIVKIIETVTIPVMAKCRIGHFAEAQILSTLGVDMVDESEVLTPADPFDHVYKKDTYAHFPAGYVRRRASAKNGAVVLTFYSGKPTARAGKPEDKKLYDAKRLVEYHNIYDVAWSQKIKRDPKSKFNAQGISLQILRTDPYTKERTWLFGSTGFWEGGNVEIHPVVEESYMLSGSMVGTYGERKPGGYFWRPPGLEHGPLGSSMGGDRDPRPRSLP